MKTFLAALLTALLALSAPQMGFAADEGEQAGSATESTTTTTEEGKGDTASDTMDQGAADDRGDTKAATEDEHKSHGMNVHRHRAGACPEGPPCPTD